MLSKYVVVALIVLMAFGCSAKVNHAPAKVDGVGIRYYQSSPYLLVYSNSKGGLRWQILYLPDQTKMMMAEPQLWGGRSEMTLYFRNGIMTNSTALGDTTELPKAVLTAVQSAIPLLAGLAAAAAEPPKVPPPYLYKIIVTGNTVTFIGGPGDSPIIVPSI